MAADYPENITIEITDRHAPLLDSGDYTLSICPSIRSKSGVLAQYRFAEDDTTAPGITRKFSVLGPRFTLSPQAIHAEFPPQGNRGDYRRVLPHLVLRRSTLPWERSPDAATTTGDRAAWLALLVIDDEEERRHVRAITNQSTVGSPVRTVKLGGLRQGGAGRFPLLATESGDKADDDVSVIDIDATFLSTIAPTRRELCLLAHVRHREIAPDQPSSPSDGGDYAVIVANRLPHAGKRHAVYLVSMEGRYSGETFDTGKIEDQSEGAGNDDVRLVVFKRWQFTCTDGKGESSTFGELVRGLDRGTLRGPASTNTDAERYLGMGFVPLRQHQINGHTTVAWYHGPLICGASDADASPSDQIQHAAQLLRRNQRLGIDDVGHAAAWELGRLLTLQNNAASVALYNWKRCCHQQACHAHVCDQMAHLPCSMPERQHAFPRHWFDGLARLEGIPFNYLVADEKSLPPESIRSFQIDPVWIECLLRGAFSVGTTTSREHAAFTADRKRELAGIKLPVSGFLLRSDLVSGWPQMKILGNAAAAAPSVIRHVSKNVLLCLFDDLIETVDIYLPPVAVHFSIDDHIIDVRQHIAQFATAKAFAFATLDNIVKV